MRIGELAARTGTTVHAIRWYERRGLLPAVARTTSGYREYDEADSERLRLLTALRALDLPLDKAAALAALCLDGQCEHVSDELRRLIVDKRGEIARRSDELRYLDGRLADLVESLEAGASPRALIATRDGKEVRHAS